MQYPAAPYPGQYPNWPGPTLNFPSPMGELPVGPSPSLADSEFREMVKEGINQLQEKKRHMKRRDKRKSHDKVRAHKYAETLAHYTLTIKLNYLGYPGFDNHIFFDTSEGKVWVPYQNYISVPLIQVVDQLLEILTKEGTCLCYSKMRLTLPWL